MRWPRIVVRSLHILAFAGLYGGLLFGADDIALRPWWSASVASGFLLAMTFSYGTPGWWLELRGLLVLFKFALVLGAWWIPQFDIGLMTAALLISGVSSHMPGKWRYKKFWGEETAEAGDC